MARWARRHLGRGLHQQQDLVGAVDVRAARALLVGEAHQSHLLVAASTDSHLVVVHPDRLPDVLVRPAVGCQEQDAGPGDVPLGGGLTANSAFQDLTITIAQLQGCQAYGHSSCRSTGDVNHIRVINAREH